MRALVGLFGTIAGAITVALVARYGYVTADTELDGAISAFFFATIAIGGLGGHSIAVRLWGKHPIAAVIVGVVATVALGVNLTNSLGAIASRGDKTAAERTKVADELRDARSELVKIEARRAALPDFAPTTEIAVTAAQAAVTSAERAREQECSRLGPNCRTRVAEETSRRVELSKAIGDKATTDAAAKLDADAATVRKRIADAAPTRSTNSHGVAIARLLRLPESAALTAAIWQNFAVAVIVELLIVVAGIAFELLRPEPRPVADAAVPAMALEHGRGALPAIAHAPMIESPSDAIERFVMERVRPAEGARVSGAELFAAYERWCEREGFPPVSLASFGRLVNWRKGRVGGRVWYFDASLA